MSNAQRNVFSRTNRTLGAHTLRIVLAMAVNNLIANRWKTVVIGSMGASATLLLVVGLSLLNDIERCIQNSITGSLSGHIQVYSNNSRDELELLGSVEGGLPRLAPIDDFARVRSVLLGTPNVRAVVPMGVNVGAVLIPSTLDEALTRLRMLTDNASAATCPPALMEQYGQQKSHVQHLVLYQQQEQRNAALVTDHAQLVADAQALERAASETFWHTFDEAPYEHLEFLDNRISPLTASAEPLPIAYIGTDPQAFAAAFPRMEIVAGTPIPAGERGIILSTQVYEEQFKLKAARGLDKLLQALEQGGRSIASSPALQRLVRESRAAVPELLMQLEADRAARMASKLRDLLKSDEPDLGKLLSAFFATDDTNLSARHRFFYQVLAPELSLYRVRVGDAISLQTVTRRGYVQSASLKLYGTYAFRGLEHAPQANQLNIVDLVSFRQLYGVATAEHDRELEALQASSGVRNLEHARAEEELFATKQPVQALRASTEVADLSLAKLRGTRTQRTLAASFDPEELRRGMTLHAAVILEDPSLSHQTLRTIDRRLKQANLSLKAVAWQRAVGALGQFTDLMRGMLWTAAFVIFGVALIVLNNALVMAALERVRELGTLRALGAQRSFVIGLLVTEALVSGALASGLGSAIGVGVLQFLGQVGIPASDDQTSFLFAGARLFPTLSRNALLGATTAVLGISLISGIYPAWLASRVSPRVAMQADD